MEHCTIKEWVLDNLHDMAQIHQSGVIVDEERPLFQYTQLVNNSTTYQCEYGSSLEACVFGVVHKRNITIYDERSMDDDYHLAMSRFVSHDVPSIRFYFAIVKVTTNLWMQIQHM